MRNEDVITEDVKIIVMIIGDKISWQKGEINNLTPNPFKRNHQL